MPRPVGELMGEGAVKSLRVVEGGDGRHVDAVDLNVIVGAGVGARLDGRAGARKEGVKLGVGGGAEVARWLGADVKFLGQTVDLVGVEHTVGSAVGNLLLGIRNFWLIKCQRCKEENLSQRII